MSKGKILFQLTGSIACYKACALVSRLVQAGYDLEVVASTSALKFVGEATLEGLVSKPVHTDTFARGEAMEHIHLAKWADLVLLCPATANTINKLSAGIGDDLISTLFLAHDFSKPYLIAPAMNTRMYRHPATAQSLERLRQWGVEILETGSGSLACGDVGEGRLMEPEQLFVAIEKHMATLHRSSERTAVAAPAKTAKATLPAAPKRIRNVLITSGGTREPIDGVRALTNFSTGRTGAVIADHLARNGFTVTYLHAQGAIMPENREGKGLRTRDFMTFTDLERNLRHELSNAHYDAIIHMAAVSDFSIESLESNGQRLEPKSDGKIESDSDLIVRLKRNPKLVDNLRQMSRNADIKVVAFKLTRSHAEQERLQAVQKLASHAQPDWIVHNDLHEIDPKGELHLSTIYVCRNHQQQRSSSALDPSSPDLKAIERTETKTALAAALAQLIADKHLKSEGVQK